MTAKRTAPPEVWAEVEAWLAGYEKHLYAAMEAQHKQLTAQERRGVGKRTPTGLVAEKGRET